MRQRPRFVGIRGVFVGTVAAVASALSLGIACSDSGNYDGLPDPGYMGNDASVTPAPVVPCHDGETRECGITLGNHNGVLSCYKGTQYCAGTEWTDCGEGGVINLDASKLSTASFHLASLSSSADCVNNPCDPTCKNYNEEPDGGWGEGPGSTPLYEWQGGVLSQYPTALVKKGVKEPCQSGADCQFNQQCTDVATGGNCEHNKCVTGTPLTSTCDSCAATICKDNPTCCADNTCEHDICVAGVKLDASCSACTTTVCGAHPECCTTSWNAACTGYAATMCGACTCAAGQTAYAGRCYAVASSNKTWSSARSDCTTKGKGWDYAQIDSSGENSLIQGIVGSGKDGWVGINDTSDAGSWIWANGDSSSYTNWASEPDNGGGSNQDCVLFNGSNGLWTDESCSSSNRYVCEGPQQTGQTCDSGQTLYNGACYKVITSSKKWSTQRSACTSTGSGWDLVSIGSTAENTFVGTLDSGNTDWIGATDSSTEGTWVWSSGGTASYTAWAGQPDAASSSEDCAMLTKADGLWSDEVCGDSHDYACEGPQLSGCPSGWTALGTRCVKASTSSATRANAETDCVSQGGHLATITSSGENTTAGNLLSSGQEYWLGFSDTAVEGTWKWVDGNASTYAAWLTSSPDGGNGEDCTVMLGASGLWDDQDCTKSKRWACETTNNQSSCGSGNVLHSSHCYRFGTNKTWSATRTNCTGLGSNWDVAVINDAAENAWVLTQISSSDTWIGLNDSSTEGTFVWSSGSTASYRNWYKYPDGGSAEDCAFMDGSTKAWNDDDCAASKRYICELISPVCAPGVTSNGGHCYQFGTSKSWTSAQTTCKALGTGFDLATVDSSTENTWIKGQVTSNAWVGYNDRSTEGTWVWANGTSSYTNWRPEPDGGTSDDCASYDGARSKWHDDDCNDSKRAICEGPTIAVDPCGSGEDLYNTHCYYYGGSTTKTWSSAETTCEARGSGWKLATVSTQAENNYVDDLVGTKSVWLGLNDSTTEGTFVWASGESTTYSSWATQPDDIASDECGVLQGTTGLWSSESCSGSRKAICEGPSSAGNVGSWSQSCVDKVATMCDATCDSAGSGACMPWLPAQKESYCTGKPDLAVALGCTGEQVPICNHGPVDAPAGVKIAWFNPDSGEYPKSSPDLSKRKDNGTCATTKPIPAGQCVTITCAGMVNNAEIFVNPTGTGYVNECSSMDNWSLYDNTASCGPPECSGGVSQATLRKVNMYVMVDRSSSMSGGKWDGARAALKSFFQAPTTAGIGIALEFFPLSAGASGDASTDGCGTDSPTCSTAKCGNPYVPLGTLTPAAAPTDTQEAKLIAPLQANWLQANTPSWAALVGALNWATARQQSVPNETHIVVFVTDGQPSGSCINGTAANTNTQLAVQAGLAYQTYGVRTYTVGMVGANNAALDTIAAQGGTSQAFVVDSTDATGVANQLATALQAIAGQNVSCEFKLPNQGFFDSDNARVVFSSGATSETLAQRTYSTDCGEGWYYDNPLAPTTATLCPTTCTKIKQSSNARVEIHLGCPYYKAPGEFHQTYDGLCPRDTAPQWGFLAYDTTQPPNTVVEFKVRVAPTLDKLQTASYVKVAKVPTDPSVCPFTGPAPCPKDLYEILGGGPETRYRYLELQANTTPFKANIPRINDFRITYSCLPNQ